MKTGKTSVYGKWLFRGAAALAVGLAAWQTARLQVNLVQNLVFYADRGEMLLHSVQGRAISYSMPLLSLLNAAQQHLSIDPALPARLAGLLLCLAAYGLGTRGGGRTRGALYALAVILANLTRRTHETEQLFYSLSLLLFLNLELLRQAGGGPLVSAASGTAAGITLLIRSPLFLFPPLAVLFQRFAPAAAGRKRLLGALLFLFCAYAPLVPWARLNHSLFGRLIVMEEERPVSNVITGAMGMIFTMEGDARAYAGLTRTESVYPWAVKTVLARPGNYAAAVLERIRQVFLMFPFLFLLAGCALFFSRSRETGFLAFFSGYFIFIHCLLSIEERYFYPLRYALALIAAGGAWELLKKTGLAEEKKSRDYFTAPIFLLTAALAAYGMGFVWRYPAAARPGLIALAPELAKHPREPWLLKEKGETLLAFDLTAEGLEALSQACALRAAPSLCYITATLKSGKPSAPPAAVDDWYELLLIKMLRELELKRYAAARKDLDSARAYWLSERNGIKGAPGTSDQPRLKRMLETNKSFWNTDIYGALLYFPPEVRMRLIARLAVFTELTPELERFKDAAARETRGEEDPQSYDSKLAYAEELAKTPYFSGLDGGGLPPRLDALFSALAAARKNGELAGFLLAARPPTSAIVDLFLNAADRGRLARTALKLSLRNRRNCLYPLVRCLALKGSRDEGAAKAALAAAFDNSPLFMLSAARLLAASGDGREKAELLADHAAGSPLLAGKGREELALLYQELGLYEKSLALTLALLEKDPRNSGLNNNAGVLLLFLGRDTEAETALRRALHEDKTAVYPALSLAALLARKGERAESAALYRSALENPRLPAPERERVRKELEKLI